MSVSAGPSLPRARPPRAIIFDAGNTLLRMNYAVIAGYLGGRGHAVTAALVHEAELRARVRLDEHLAPGASTESGAVHARYLGYVLEHLGITAESEVEAIAAWRRQYNLPVGLWDVADPEAPAALARVKQAGLVAGVISNSNGSVQSILERTGLARHLDFVVDSAVVGVEKPDPRIFEIALGWAGVAAHEAVYVGDLYSVDVLGARRAGLRAVLLDPRGFWGARDCPLARGLDEVVRLCLPTATPTREA
jgi:putative hydrolase of the HAD superfamily